MLDITHKCGRSLMNEPPVVTCSHTSLTLFRVNPAVSSKLLSGRITSNTQADGEEACFGPVGIAIPSSIELEPGRVLGSREP
jgi:hypothetical protein